MNHWQQAGRSDMARRSRGGSLKIAAAFVGKLLREARIIKQNMN